jgi:pimeloyl-ACP methyl ester carboxylesterase
MRLVPLCVLLFVCAPASAQHPPDALPRRADLGAAVAPPGRKTAAKVVRVTEGSPLHAAGLRAGDEVLGLDGRSFSDPIDFDRRTAALRGGQRITLDVVRGGSRREIAATLAPLARERIPRTEVVYTQVSNPRGLRQRAILTRPEGASGRLPAILFVPWLSCDSIESPTGPSPGIDLLLTRLAGESGWVMLRVDKPGVGDSEGVCADTDLDTEIEGSRAAFTFLQSHPWVDPTRIVIMGHSFSGAFLPLVAQGHPVAGYVFLNSWSRTWMERLVEFERLQLESGGAAPADVSERMRKLAEFYVLFLEQQKTPKQVIGERPQLAAVWSDEPEHQYGRHASFHHQLQAINPARAWSAVNVPTLVMWGDTDLVMHRNDHERLVALVNRNRAGAARLVVIPGADHGLAVRGEGGRRVLPEAVPRAVLDFLASAVPQRPR